MNHSPHWHSGVFADPTAGPRPDTFLSRMPPARRGPRAASAVIESDSWRMAVDLAVHQVIADDDPEPDVVVLFANPAFGEACADLVREVRERTHARTLIGCVASAVLANGEEVDRRPGLSLLALWLPDAMIHPVRLHQEQVCLFDEPDLWREVTGTPAVGVNAWLVIAEPFRIDVQSVLKGLTALYPGSSIMGGIASGMQQDRQASVFFDDQVYDEGGVALAIGGPYQIVPFVSQGCEPVGEAWTVTATDRNTILTISNQPALDVLRNAIATLPEHEREGAHNNLVVGFAVDEYRDAFHRGDFIIRGLLGIDPDEGALTVGGMPRVGQTIQFHVRDARTADVDLHQMLVEARAHATSGSPVAGLLCTCVGRGVNLFDTPNHDPAAVQAAFGSLPVVGAHCRGEIGPLGGRTVLHGFTATFGLLMHDDGLGPP